MNGSSCPKVFGKSYCLRYPWRVTPHGPVNYYLPSVLIKWTIKAGPVRWACPPLGIFSPYSLLCSSTSCGRSVQKQNANLSATTSGVTFRCRSRQFGNCRTLLIVLANQQRGRPSVRLTGGPRFDVVRVDDPLAKDVVFVRRQFSCKLL